MVCQPRADDHFVEKWSRRSGADARVCYGPARMSLGRCLPAFLLAAVAAGVACGAPESELGESLDSLTTTTSIPATPQRPGDPERGYDALLNEGFISLGIPWTGFMRNLESPLEPRDTLPGRRGVNTFVPYNFTVSSKECLGAGPRETFSGLSAREVKCLPGEYDAGPIVAPNCLGCHATHLNGQLIVGLGRASHDPPRPSGSVGWYRGAIGRIWVSLFGGAGTAQVEFERFGLRLLRGNSLDTFALQAAYRDPKTLVWTNDDEERFDGHSGLEGWIDVPPWWRMKKKNALYYNGMGRGDQVRHMMNMTIFSVKDVAEATKIDGYFNDIATFIRSIEPPKFPGSIDVTLASRGEKVFTDNCSSCHGTYGSNETYPNLLVPYAVVGTDPELATHPWANRKAAAWFNASWYGATGARLEPQAGYVAPPLDGIWATAPFFHNGSVPTLEAVLDSSKRPARWSMNFVDDSLDLETVGWKWQGGTGSTYDTRAKGSSNQGHLR